MEQNEVLDAIISRRSCKSYKGDAVPMETIDKIVEAGLFAASGMNRQSPRIIVVTDRETRDALSLLNAKYDPQKRKDPFYNAPVVLCVIAPKDEPTALYDGSLAIGNMMLAAHSLGLGSCWIHRAREMFDDAEGKALLSRLGLSGEYVGIGNCVIGYAEKQNSATPPRKDGRVFKV